MGNFVCVCLFWFLHAHENAHEGSRKAKGQELKGKIVSESFRALKFRPYEKFIIILLQPPVLSFYSQHRQNYPNNYIRAKVGRELPKQFLNPPLVGKQGVSNVVLYILQRHSKPGIS